jgi:hypothetical protein
VNCWSVAFSMLTYVPVSKLATARIRMLPCGNLPLGKV